MLAYREYRHSLCPGGCGHPTDRAHHPDNDGWYEGRATTCYACTARAQAEQGGSREPVKPVTLIAVDDVRDYDKKPLPPMPARPERRRR